MKKETKENIINLVGIILLSIMSLGIFLFLFLYYGKGFKNWKNWMKALGEVGY